MMKKIALTIVAAISLAAGAAFADGVKPNRVTQSFAEFIEASGCVIVDKGGYSNLASVKGGACPQAVVTAFTGAGTKTLAGVDGILGTADDVTVSDN